MTTETITPDATTTDLRMALETGWTLTFTISADGPVVSFVLTEDLDTAREDDGLTEVLAVLEGATVPPDPLDLLAKAAPHLAAILGAAALGGHLSGGDHAE